MVMVTFMVELLEEILLSQKQSVQNRLSLEKIIPREAKLPKTQRVKIVEGIRRAGKSTYILAHLEESREHYGYVNFYDDRLLDYSSEQIMQALRRIYGGNVKMIFLDEVHRFPRWNYWVSRLHWEGYNVYVTGSNACVLEEMGTTLTGRVTRRKLYPFSFREFLLAKGLDLSSIEENDGGKIINYLKEYIKVGGFPEVVIKNEDPYDYYYELFSGVIKRDIILHYGLSRERSDKFEKIAFTLLENISNPVSLEKLANKYLIYESSRRKRERLELVKNWLAYLTQSHLFEGITNFSTKNHLKRADVKKIYVVDHGIFRSLWSLRYRKNNGKYCSNRFAKKGKLYIQGENEHCGSPCRPL